jgi:pimeloyl-ACP methyl ester carboxylesterase
LVSLDRVLIEHPGAHVTSERHEHQAVRLTDGRLLGFAEYGDLAGPAVVFCHGEVGSRLLGRSLEADAHRLGLRIVAPDRPGLGFSDFQPGRAIAEWPADVVELAAQLGIERFAVVGASAGAPYALACAWKVPEHLTATVLAGPALSVSMTETAPDTPALQRVLSRSAVWAPWTIRPVMTLLGQVSQRSPEQALVRMKESAGEADRPAFDRPEIRAMLTHSMAETFRSGPRGAAHDLRLVTNDWHLPFGEVSVPVEVWHGDTDLDVTPGSVRRLVDALPAGRLNVVPGGGHHLLLTHPGQVLAALAA